jgi:predicted RNA methylase
MFGGLPVNGLFGLSVEYVSGYMEGYFAACGHHTAFHLDVENRPIDARHQFRDLIRIITKEKALRDGIIQSNSPIEKTMQKYGLRFIEIIGPDITAPDPPTLELVATLVREINPQTVADLFCGTGAISKIVLIESPQSRVTAFDTMIEFARKTLQKYHSRVRILQKDVFATALRGNYDLIIADPFDYMALDFARVVVPRLARHCDTLLVSHGFARDRFWVHLVRRQLRKSFRRVYVADTGGVCFSRCC